MWRYPVFLTDGVGHVGRPPSAFVKWVSVGLRTEDAAALQTFQAREGLSNASEAVRAIMRRYLMDQGLLELQAAPEPEAIGSATPKTRAQPKRDPRGRP